MTNKQQAILWDKKLPLSLPPTTPKATSTTTRTPSDPVLGDEKTSRLGFSQGRIHRWKAGINKTTIVYIEVVAKEVGPSKTTAFVAKYRKTLSHFLNAVSHPNHWKIASCNHMIIWHSNKYIFKVVIQTNIIYTYCSTSENKQDYPFYLDHAN